MKTSWSLCALGHFVALTGPAGVGKTTLIDNVKGDGQKSKAMLISESQAGLGRYGRCACRHIARRVIDQHLGCEAAK